MTMTEKKRISVVSFAAALLVVASGGATSPEILMQSTTPVSRDDAARRLNIRLSGSLQNPVFSPDGNSIVFTRFRDGYNSGISDLYIFDLDTGFLANLVSDGSNNVNLPGSSWNDIFDSIVYSSDRSGHDEIYIITRTGNTWKNSQITDRQNKQSYEPSFSPDGEWIVFESHDKDVSGKGVITKFRTDGSGSYVDITAPAEDNRQPNWSPDGSRILYQTSKNGNWSILTVDTGGNNKTTISNADESATDAVFSLDGQWIVYSSENDNVDNANIYKIPADGGASVQITRFSGYDGAPSISRDATKIVFESAMGDPDRSTGTQIWITDNSW